MSWTTPDELRQQLLRQWERGDWLAAYVRGESLFPLTLRLRRPTSRDLAEDFVAVRRWVQQLQAGSRDERGYGYGIEWRRVNHRVHGANDLPAGAIVPSEADGLRLIGREREAARFRALAGETLRRFPSLADWLARRPLQALAEAGAWPRILDVLDWFRAHPRPGIYLRQLDIPGVDTKFIEARRRLFTELLDAVLPEAAIDPSATGARGFERRFGLREKPALVRFRLLDPALYVQGLSDLSVPPEQFADLRLPVRRVFITENEINGLAFPDHPGGLVIFGLGYGLERLAGVGWLREVAVHYWGDIDTHGFAMLHRLRTRLPHARSLLMDRETLEMHREMWGREPANKRFTGRLSLLTEAEQALFQDLREDTLQDCLRLEQERIGFGHLERALRQI
ncbi:Wadjet anti-phage system protein JetD domain-containing protein [Alkalilimnicola ehrlichii MLHE-1]|uniref:Conserved hypothetical cytosolic protein n=1 Tax=Alkalilimnicola ehrlichii (strain ATCC BAA-1101 / DSM 17681 / MLHE-1) TaxID=187272 RepID=Q0A6A2_ALKEH|nr:Wadjet anti-phage system protein JetD domain-containing protein [Alkalilimnicola ehrlichii]ABI57635.1 conserved hypothetical cytosolic protein [Alkalilimnicola ehrlichii MLHE-1]